MSGERMDARDPSARLMLAARRGELAYLKEHEDYLMLLDWCGDSVLSHAIHERTAPALEALRFCVGTRAFPHLLHLTTVEGRYPLLDAAVKGDARCVRLLLQNGARILLPAQGAAQSLLHALVASGCSLEMLALMLSELADEDKYDALARTYHAQYRVRSAEVVEDCATTALELAVRLGRTDHALLLHALY